MKQTALVLALLSLTACSSLKSKTAPSQVPVITRFECDAVSLPVNASTSCQWAIDGPEGTSAFLASSVGVNPGNVPLTGTIKVTPTLTTTYRLIASFGSYAPERTVTVVVK